jgi:hypothetical protein
LFVQTQDAAVTVAPIAGTVTSNAGQGKGHAFDRADISGGITGPHCRARRSEN